MPRVAELDRPPHRPATVPPHPDRGVGLLDGLGLEFDLRKRVIPSLILRLTIAPARLKNADPLVGFFAPAVKVQPQSLELLAQPSCSDAADHTAAREHVEGRERLGLIHRI